jgi:hypothetical protein
VPLRLFPCAISERSLIRVEYCCTCCRTQNKARTGKCYIRAHAHPCRRASTCHVHERVLTTPTATAHSPPVTAGAPRGTSCQQSRTHPTRGRRAAERTHHAGAERKGHPHPQPWRGRCTKWSARDCERELAATSRPRCVRWRHQRLVQARLGEAFRESRGPRMTLC